MPPAPPPEPAWLETISRHWPGFALGSPPEALRGGNLNHVWRLRLREGGAVILKHAPPYVAAQPEVPLSPTRLDFEARALALFGAGGKFQHLGADSASIRPPRLLHHDAERHFMLCEDVGAGPDIAAAVVAGTIGSSLRPGVGRDLGVFIGRLHAESVNDAALACAFDNRAIQETRLHVQYLAAGNLARAAGIAPQAIAALDRNATTLGHRLLGPGHCLVMGDLWPPSILTLVGRRARARRTAPASGLAYDDAAETNDPAAPLALRLIDWEFAHYGHPLQDLAHFGAHCWMQAQTAATPDVAHDFRALRASFFAGYREAVGSALAEFMPSEEERFMNLHAGAEILLRSVGPFVRGYRYDGLGRDHPLVREAVAQAVSLLSEPPVRFFVD